MYIFIDTNIFFNNWFLASPNFTFLINFANNTGAKLLMSSVVCQEVENKYRAAREEYSINIDRLRSDFRDLRIDSPSIEKPSVDFEYDFHKIVDEKFDAVEIIPYSDTSHEILMHKALHSLRPFRGKDKGYRDSLIWLSLLAYLRSRKDSSPVAFITNNCTDFFDVKEKDKEKGSLLHADLLSDVTQSDLKNKFVPYISLKAFVESVIDTKTHAFNHEEFKDEHGDAIERAASHAAIVYVNSLPLPDCKALMVKAGYPLKCMDMVTSFHFDDYEGLEDPDVVHMSDVGGGKIFLKYQFNLLTVSFDGIVPTEGYFAEKEMFDRYFLNVTEEGLIAEVQSFPRIYYEASIIFDRATEEVCSMSIDSAMIRYRY